MSSLPGAVPALLRTCCHWWYTQIEKVPQVAVSVGVVAVRLRVFDVETANVVKIYAHHGRPLSTKRQEKFRIKHVLFGRPQWQATRCFAMRLPAYRFKREVPEDIGKVKASQGAAGDFYSKMVDDVMNGSTKHWTNFRITKKLGKTSQAISRSLQIMNWSWYVHVKYLRGPRTWSPSLWPSSDGPMWGSPLSSTACSRAEASPGSTVSGGGI